ncbi:MAG: isocitrate/isopropylmalate dehydrogenase family protein, partial [Gemmatimonadaceae bacterium]
MSEQTLAVIAGDGIGPEVVREALKVLRAVDAVHRTGIVVEMLPYGADHYLKTGETLPAAEMRRLGHDVSAIFVGALGDPRVPGNEHARDILLGMRFQLDLYVNERPARLFDARLTPLRDKSPDDIDLVVFRENTEGLYVAIGGTFKQGTADEIAIAEELNTRKGVERIIRYAFEYCERHAKTDGSRRKNVLMCDKSNAMTHAGGLWQRVFREVAEEYPQIISQHMFVDALCMQMVRDPRQFDVIVTNNLFGDIITDLAAALQGGLGMAASGNIHPGKTSMFEPVHGSAPMIAGKNIANP